MESYKCVKNPSLKWLLLFSLVPVVLNHLFIQIMSYDEFLIRVQSVHGDENPYNYIFRWFKVIYGYFLIPYSCILIIWLINIEKDSNGWKYLITLPVSTLKILYSKLLVIGMLLFLSVIISMTGFLTSAHLLSLIKTDWYFNQYVAYDFSFLILIFFKVYLAMMLAVTLQFFTVLFFNNAAITIASVIVLELIKSYINPFNFHLTALESYWRYKEFVNEGILRTLLDTQNSISIVISLAMILSFSLISAKKLINNV
jgi:hypothetical protein